MKFNVYCRYLAQHRCYRGYNNVFSAGAAFELTTLKTEARRLACASIYKE